MNELKETVKKMGEIIKKIESIDYILKNAFNKPLTGIFESLQLDLVYIASGFSDRAWRHEEKINIDIESDWIKTKLNDMKEKLETELKQLKDSL